VRVEQRRFLLSTAEQSPPRLIAELGASRGATPVLAAHYDEREPS
jgi:hypothetical protein